MELIGKQPYNKLKFKCKKCGFCCDNTIIQLYPFDIYALCKKLNLTTKQFHEQYSMFMIDNQGIPRCLLKNRPNCMFKEGNLCKVYDARPARCRLFPVGRIFNKDSTEYVIPEQQCIGFDTGHKQTIEGFIRENSTEELDMLSAKWNSFLLGIKESGIAKNQLFPIIFRKVFYDFDDSMISKYRTDLRKEEEMVEFLDNLIDIFEGMAKEMLGAKTP